MIRDLIVTFTLVFIVVLTGTTIMVMMLAKLEPVTPVAPPEIFFTHDIPHEVGCWVTVDAIFCIPDQLYVDNGEGHP